MPHPTTTPPPATTSSTAHDSGAGRDLLAGAATAVTLPFTLARQLLPDNPVPVALGAGALAIAGVIEWPVAAAAGLGYLALRRWQRPVTGETTAPSS